MSTTPFRAMSIMHGSSAQAVAALVDVCFPDAVTALDATYGNGQFWAGVGTNLRVIGMDSDPDRARNVCGDFQCLPFRENSVDLVLFDPPYLTDVGRQIPSRMASRFGAIRTVDDLERAVTYGAQQAWCVARLGVIIKIQNYIHASRLVHMTRWVEQALPMPMYDEMHLYQTGKMLSPKWTRQMSVWRNHSTFVVYRKDGPVHRERAIPRELLNGLTL